MILVGDIGGTKTLLALYGQQDNVWVCAKKQNFASADYAEFDQILDVFLESSDLATLQSVCIGVAGPVINGQCKTTNLPWLLNRDDIAHKLNVSQVFLLNDLEATAWGVLAQADDQFTELNPQATVDKLGHKAVIAAGTGLGEAIIMQANGENFVLAGEGGHTDFGPNSDQEIALLVFLRNKYPQHVSYERLVSGEGLYNIYQFLKLSHEGVETEQFNHLLQTRDPAAVIGAAGVMQENELSTKSVNLFCQIYGAEAANLALKCMPYGGVFLAGGIAGKLLPVLQQGGFMNGFLAKGRYRDVLQSFSVKVCGNAECGLDGALVYAQERLI